MTPTYTSGSGGTYYLIGYNNTTNCNDTATAQINILPKPEADAGLDTSLCKKDNIILNGSHIGTATSYKWYPATGLSNPTLLQPVLNVTQTLPYYFIASEGNCSDTDMVNISYVPVEVKALNDTAICTGSMMTLHSTGSGGSNFSWSPQTNSMINPNSANAEITAMNTDIYYVTLLSTDGNCTDTDTVVVLTKLVPEVNAGPDMSVCSETTVQLKGSGTAGGSYQWFPTTGLNNPQIIDPLLKIKEGALYSLTITLPNGCAATDTLSVGIGAGEPEFKILPERTEVCMGKIVSLFAGGGAYYKWTPSEGLSSDTIQSPILTVNKSETYNVRIVDFCGRDTVLSVRVDMLETPWVKVEKSNDIDCHNKEAVLVATGADSYAWLPLEGLQMQTGEKTVASPDGDMVYTVTGTNRFGCTDTANVEVLRLNGAQFKSPNAFSPNGDGSNDCYNLMLPIIPTEFEFMIFNRWGNKVFETNDINDCWDGRYKGTSQPEEVYVYYYKLTSADCGDVFNRGNITLVR